MKRQGSNTTKFAGEERVRDGGGSFFKKFLETSKNPSIIDTESIKSAQKALASEAKTEFSVVVNQILGIELSAGKAFSLSRQERISVDEVTPEKPRATVEHLNYASDFLRKAESHEKDSSQVAISRQIEEIQAQLKQIKNSSDVLEGEFRDVVIDEIPEKPGVYHLTFFEGFLKLILKVKDKIDDATIFAKLFKSRKAERSYTSMAKKRGTSYTLHHDRSVATQTG